MANYVYITTVDNTHTIILLTPYCKQKMTYCHNNIWHIELLLFLKSLLSNGVMKDNII